ncbi:MAG TPA: efflux RND transporter permease subunit [Myxococcota bacterium]|nr:efflux RND transporter permease subunit [Myxococcota bacterium]
MPGGLRRRAGAVFALLALLVAAGIESARRLPAAIFPSVTFPLVKVIADVGEEPAARMMPTVTRPLEEAIRRVPGVERVLSTTSRGSAELTAQFGWDTDMPGALQRVEAEAERIDPDLPSDTRLDVEWMNTAVMPIEGYALTSESLSQAELWELAEYSLKPAFLRIPGVSEIQIQGGRRREFQVRLDPAALQGRALSAADVVNAIRENHRELSAGWTERNHELYLALVDGRVDGLERLSRISVPVAAGPPAALAELGELRVADQVSYIRTTADASEAVLLNVIRQPTANTLAIASQIQELLRSRPELIPPGVRFTTFYDQAAFVRSSLRGARDALVIGVLLAALVLFAFLRRVRPVLVAVAAIPVTVSIVGIALAAAGETINLMTLAGVAAALGLIADDAIVVVEELAYGNRVRDVLPALAGSSLSTTVILLPFCLVPGLVGAFFRPLALTMAMALGVSFAVASLAVPLAVELLGGAAPAGSGAPARGLGAWVASRHAAVARFAVSHGSAAALAALLLVASAAAMYRGVGSDFLPEMDEGAIVLDYWTPPGTSLTDTDAMLRQVEKEILSFAEVVGYSRRTGTQLGFFITEPNRGDYVINLKPRSQRRPVDEVIEDLRAHIAAAEPALHTDFGQLLEDAIGDLTGGAPQPVDVKLFGSDVRELEAGARQVAQILQSVRGVDDVFDGIVVAGPALEMRVNPEAAARYGLTATSLHAEVEPAIFGTVLEPVRVGDRMYDLRVLSRSAAGELGDLPVRAGGALLRLRDVASISTGPPETEIHREDLKTYVGITARLDGRDLGGAMAEIRGRLDRELARAPGMSIAYGGQFEQQQRSFRDLSLVLLSSLVLVAVLVLFQFGDWRASLATMACALASLAGSLLALLCAGMTLNVSSYVGAIMMVGIVGENAIFVIHEAHRALAAGAEPGQAWLAASERRLRPVAMTSLATVFALAPLALALGQGAQLMQPLAVAVIGGFALSAPLVLWVLPGLCRWLGR